ncbi:MAG: hypothetical protein V1652_04400 [bacterium]
MSDKKPAHVVIVEMIREAVEILGKGDEVDDEPRTVLLMGMLSAEIEMLKRMVIPEKHREEVAMFLQQIKEQCSPEVAEKLLPNSVFLAIAPSEEETKA